MNVHPAKLMIVRRGQFATFELLARTFAEEVRIIWDRRMGDRRQAKAEPDAGERRRLDRRRPPPTQWGQLHYMVAGPNDFPSGAPA